MSILFSTYSIRHRHISQILRTRYLQRHGFFFTKVRVSCLPYSRSHFNMAAVGSGSCSPIWKESVLYLLLLWFLHFFRLFMPNCFRGRSDETHNGEEVLAYTGLFEFLGVDASPNNSLFNSDWINLCKVKLWLFRAVNGACMLAVATEAWRNRKLKLWISESRILWRAWAMCMFGRALVYCRQPSQNSFFPSSIKG